MKTDDRVDLKDLFEKEVDDEIEELENDADEETDEDDDDDTDDSEDTAGDADEGDSDNPKSDDTKSADDAEPSDDAAEKRRQHNREQRQLKKQKKREYQDALKAEAAYFKSKYEELNGKVETIQSNTVKTELSGYEQRLKKASADYDEVQDVIKKLQQRITDAEQEGALDKAAYFSTKLQDAKTIKREIETEANQINTEYESRKKATTPVHNPHNTPETIAHKRKFLEANKKRIESMTPAQQARLVEIDNRIAAEGYDSRLPGYWEKLQEQVDREFGVPKTNDRPKTPIVGGSGDGPKTIRKSLAANTVPANVVAQWRKLGADVDNKETLAALKKNYLEHNKGR